jgi:hypothetical protein
MCSWSRCGAREKDKWESSFERSWRSWWACLPQVPPRRLRRRSFNAVAIGGVHVEIGSSDVRIEGAPGFSETYRITQNSSGSVGFQSGAKPQNFGYLNRTTSRLSLSQKGEGDRIVQWFAGDCTPAK